MLVIHFLLLDSGRPYSSIGVVVPLRLSVSLFNAGRYIIRFFVILPGLKKSSIPSYKVGRPLAPTVIVIVIVTFAHQ